MTTQTTDPRLRPDSRLTAAEVERNEADGTWRAVTLRGFLAQAAERWPDRVAAVGYAQGRADPAATRTYQELDARVSRLAAGLRALGAGPGVVVGVMLPNRVEFAELIFAINETGATYTGIPATYGAREVEQILGQSGARIAVVDAAAPLALVRGLRDRLAVEHVVVVGEDGAPGEAGAGEVGYAAVAAAATDGVRADDPSAVAQIGYTSGTTGPPKGVMNTAQTLEAILRNWLLHVGGPASLGDPAVNLIASPIGHHTGFCWGVLLSAYVGATSVFLDRWQPAVGAQVIREQGVTTLFCAPTFVQDLVALDDPALRSSSLELITIAGAPIPRSLPALAGDALGCRIGPAWGMTEYAIAVAWAPRLGAAGLQADGVPVTGAEIRVVAEDGTPAGAGVVGELEMRGAGLFIGYHDQPEANAQSFADGWFRTGDTAMLDEQGQVSLVGRSKDIVIRGGENIPVADVESVLFTHPKVRDLAVIGLPDPRLGQRACAVVVAAGGEPPTLAELCAHLQEHGVSKRFWPEHLKVIEALPKTASGKIRKVELKEWYA